MADDSSTVSIVFKGSAQSVEDAIKRVSGQLGSLDRTATEASAGLHKTASAEAEVEAEAKGLTRGVEVAADAMSLLSKESSEATRRLYEVRSLASDMRGAFSSMGSAIVGGAAAFAGVAAIGFMSGAVKEALAGEQAQAKLNAALKGNKDQIEQVNKSAEDGATTWAKYGVTVGNLKGILATALGKGIDPSMILGNAKGLADLKVALGTDIPGAIDAVTNGPKSAKALSRALNLNKQDAMNLALAMNTAYTANARMAVALQFTEKSRFAGQGDALANTDTGKMLQFQTSMKDLQETLGQGVIPLMGNFATALNGMVQAANSLLAGVGGLSGILGSKWVPIIALSLVGLKGFLGVVNLIEGLFRTKFVSTLMGTRQEIDQGARATADYVKALDDIPPAVVTTAHFEDTAAKAEKDGVYIPDLNLVDGRVVTTTATFIPANIPAEPALQPITVPVTYDTAHAFSEATPTPLSVPVTYDTSRALTEATPKPIAIPVTYDTANAVPESIPKPLSVPVTYDTTKPLVESAPHPIKVPVIYAGTLTEQHGAPIKIPVIYQGTLHENATHPEHVKVIYDGSLSETQSHPVKVPVIYQGVFHEASGHALHIPVVYDDTHKLNISGTEHVTPQLAGDAQRTLQTELTAQGPLAVRVRPQWVSNAAEGLRQGIAGGVAFGIADAIFNGSVVIKHATIPTVRMPAASASHPAGVQQVAIFQGPRDPLHVYVVNPGAIGSARGTTTVPTGPMHVVLDGHPYVGLVPNQTLKVSNFPASIGATTPTGSTVTMPNTIKAKQDGPWTVSLSPDAIGRFGQMVGEIAIGSALGNIFGGLGLGKLKGFLDKWNKDKGAGGSNTPGDGSTAPTTVPLAEGEVLAEAQQYLKGIAPPTTNPNSAPFTFTKGHDPVVDALKGINWAGSIKAGLIAASFPLLAGAAVGAALLGGLGSIFGATGAEAASGPVKKARAEAQKGFGTIALDMVNGVVGGIKGAAGALAAIGKTIITTLMQGIRNALPGPVQGAFDTLTHNAYKPHQGHGGPTDTKKPGPPGGWTGGSIGASGLTSVSPGLAAQLLAMTGLHVPTSTAAARAGGHTVNVQAGAIVVNGGAAPAHDVAVEVRKQLQEFVNAL